MLCSMIANACALNRTESRSAREWRPVRSQIGSKAIEYVSVEVTVGPLK